MTSAASREILTSLTYQSRAAAPMSVAALRELERASKARNGSVGITGLAVYDDGRFFQWLEGPAEQLAPVWAAINRDPRHTDIKDVAIRSSSGRMFGDWNMALTIRGEAPPLPRFPRGGHLRAVGTKRVALETLADPASALVIPVVPVLVETVAIPHVFSTYGAVRRFLPPVSSVAARLSHLLLADDAAPAARILRQLYYRAGALAPLCATVLEPAARNLGDLWLADDCTELAMTVALCRLHTLVRRLIADAGQVALGLPAVLVAPQPGEVHTLGTALDAHLLWQAGWDTHQEFPATDSALQATLADTWFDLLDLSLSPALHRTDSLPLMAATVAGARAASRNPELTVIVGGRAFFEGAADTATVGADASTTSALQIVLTATAAHKGTLTRLAERSGT
jgi:hypothetical protein